MAVKTLAAHLAFEAGLHERACGAHEMPLHSWDQLKDEERTRDLLAKLDTLDLA